MVPSFCRFELPQPSYRHINIKTLQVFLRNAFFAHYYNGFILKISTCAIMLGFRKSGHIYLVISLYLS